MIELSTSRREFPSARSLNSDLASDWHRATTAQHSMLLEGPDESIEALLLLLAPLFREPVTWNRRGAPLDLPSGEGGTLVLQHIASLPRHDQARLREWLDEPTRRTQVVSTTAYPLFPLADGSLFDPTLYYRLNVVRFSFVHT